MAQLKPQDDYMKTALRLPRDLHAKIQEEAAASGRSMNAEIVARLQDSFLTSFEREVPPLQQFYILLDSSGYPISWFEILEHVRGLSNAAGVEPIDLKMEVVTPDMESNSRRATETSKLAAFYRKQGKSTKMNGQK